MILIKRIFEFTCTLDQSCILTLEILLIMTNRLVHTQLQLNCYAADENQNLKMMFCRRKNTAHFAHCNSQFISKSTYVNGVSKVDWRRVVAIPQILMPTISSEFKNHQKHENGGNFLNKQKISKNERKKSEKSLKLMTFFLYWSWGPFVWSSIPEEKQNVSNTFHECVLASIVAFLFNF